jgi:hypothetical protein
MLRRQLAPAFSLAVLLASPLAAASGEAPSHIFEVIAAGCRKEPPERSQTGFLVRRRGGVITALHGVIGCSRITLRSSTDELHLSEPVQVVGVDIDSDAALLSSNELRTRSRIGLKETSQTDVAGAERVFVRGYPLGIKDLQTSLEVRTPAITSLEAILPPSIHNDLAARGSPTLKLRILSIQGDLLPGHSGAPILDAAGSVLAMADGGLQIGARICWAVPMSEIHFTSDLESARLAQLREADVAQLFAFERGPKTAGRKPPPAENPNRQPASSTMRFAPFNLTLTGCQRLGANLSCDFLVENTGSNAANLALSFGSTFAYDEQGAEYGLEQAAVGSRSWSADQFGAVAFEPNLAVRAKLVFRSIPDRAQRGSLRIVLAVVATGGPQAFFGPNPQWRSLIFRAVPFKS